MEITQLSLPHPDEWPYVRQQCRDFFRRYGSKRLTLDGVQRLGSLTYDQLKEPGTSIIAATVRGDVGSIPIGMCYAEDYGESACLIAVHPLYRSRGIGSSLIRSQLSRLGRLRCKVAADHIASLKICFQAGLQATEIELGPTGKPTLVLNGVMGAPSSSFRCDV